MGVIIVLLAVSVTVATIFLIAFVASVRAGQYDDTYTPSVRMLFEDEAPASPEAAEPTDIRNPINLSETD